MEVISSHSCLFCRRSKCLPHDGIWRCQARVGRGACHRPPKLQLHLEDEKAAFPGYWARHLQEEELLKWGQGSLCPLH